MQNDKLTEFIFANQLSSVMNRTKWKELAQEMTSHPEFNPEVRIKYLDDPVAGSSFCHLDWEWVKLGDARIIEWIEIDSTRRTYVGQLVDKSTSDFSSWVRQALCKHSIPFDEAEGIFRINGYLKPNS
ncbi:DUF6678 family protein, partial [Hymenobacter sp. APR13]|uniref:DUF6678 family protein n=1 Tax=Hymenobacter sp. APR13 TaxID=1356852 RepID=UPI0004E05E03